MRAAGPGQSALLALDVIDVLNRQCTPYAIIGAFAASFYGVVRASMDVDIVIASRYGQADLQALTDGFHKAGLKTTHRTGGRRDPVGAVLNVSDPFGNRVDLLMAVRGMSEAIFTRAVETAFMKTPIRVVGLEDFIAMKLFAGSTQDVADAAGALTVSGARLRQPLLRELAAAYGKEALQRLDALLRRGQPR